MTALLAALVMVLPALRPVPVTAHGGYPLSLGSAAVEGHEELARLVLVYLNEGQGMTVEPLRFESPADLVGAFREGRVDLVITAPDADWQKGGCAGAEGKPSDEARKNYFRDRFPGCWSVGLAAPPGSAGCGVSLVAHSRVAGDLRFSLLEKTLTRLVSALGAEDVASLLAEGATGPRSQAAAARKLLRGKGLL